MGGRDLGMDTRKNPKNNLYLALNVYHYQLMKTGGRGHSLLGRECNCVREELKFSVYATSLSYSTQKSNLLKGEIQRRHVLYAS